MSPTLWPLSSFSFTSASPAMARNVGSQSWWPTISFETVPGLILPGQRTMQGTR